MESDLAIFASQMHNIKVRYHIVGKQEELQEIYDLYQTFIQKERPAMEEDEGDVYESIEDIWPDYPSKDDFLWNDDEY